MVIKALETLEEFEKAQIITDGRLNGRSYAYKCGLADGKRKALEQETCADAVSRKRLMDNYNGVETPVGYRKVVDLEVIKNMPSVTPTRKKGKWIEVWDKDHLVILAYKCSECETMRNTKNKLLCRLWGRNGE